MLKNILCCCIYVILGSYKKRLMHKVSPVSMDKWYPDTLSVFAAFGNTSYKFHPGKCPNLLDIHRK